MYVGFVVALFFVALQTLALENRGPGTGKLLNRGAHIHLFLHEERTEINSHGSKSGALQCRKTEEGTLIYIDPGLQKREKTDNSKLDNCRTEREQIRPSRVHHCGYQQPE